MLLVTRHDVNDQLNLFLPCRDVPYCMMSAAPEQLIHLTCTNTNYTYDQEALIDV